MLRLRVAMLALALPLWASIAEGQVPDEETRQRVGELGTEGLGHYDAGNCEAALEKFDAAAVILKTPTLELYAARCLSRLDRIVDAVERYRAIAGLFPNDTSPAFMSAKDQAKLELVALLRRAPKVRVEVTGGWAEGMVVRLDGEPLDEAAIESPIPVDPGRHVVDAENGSWRACQVTNIAMGATEDVLLDPRGKAAPVPKPDAEVPSDDVHLILGWGMVALGGGGLVAGGVLAGVAAAKQSDLEEQGCTQDLCPVTFADDVSSYDAMRIGSTAAFIAGGVVVALGVTLLLTLPPDPDQDQGASVALALSPGAATARVRF